MHMADALLSPAVGGGFWAGTAGFILYAAKKLKGQLNEKMIPLMGVLGAFVFAGQMINFTIPGTGSSGHIGGGMLLAILLGPHAAFIVIASVLTVQALFFADGGLLALGCNIWNLGVYPAYIAYPLIYRAIAGDAPSGRKITVASVAGVVAALQMGAFSVVLQTKLSGISGLPFGPFLLLMQPIHLAIGVVEGIITAGVVNYVWRIQPEIFEINKGPGTALSIRKVLAVLAVLAVITGGIFSWFASTHPDGLEWSVEKIYGEPEIHAKKSTVLERAAGIQEKTAFMPDYGFPPEPGEDAGEDEGHWPAVDPGTSVAGLVGGLIVFGSVLLAGLGLRRFGRRSAD